MMLVYIAMPQWVIPLVMPQRAMICRNGRQCPQRAAMMPATGGHEASTGSHDASTGGHDDTTDRPWCLNRQPWCLNGRPWCLIGRPRCLNGRPWCPSVATGGHDAATGSHDAATGGHDALALVQNHSRCGNPDMGGTMLQRAAQMRQQNRRRRCRNATADAAKGGGFKVSRKFQLKESSTWNFSNGTMFGRGTVLPCLERRRTI